MSTGYLVLAWKLHYWLQSKAHISFLAHSSVVQQYRTDAMAEVRKLWTGENKMFPSKRVQLKCFQANVSKQTQRSESLTSASEVKLCTDKELDVSESWTVDVWSSLVVLGILQMIAKLHLFLMAYYSCFQPCKKEMIQNNLRICLLWLYVSTGCFWKYWHIFSLPALVFITAQTLLGARINPWTLEIHIHHLSSPFEPLLGNQRSLSECLPFLAKQISTLRRT